MSNSNDLKRVDLTKNPDMQIKAGAGKQRTIFVNSAILKESSPVFNAMLGPNFLEGSNLRKARGSYELLLPDDDEYITFIALAAFHHRTMLILARLNDHQIFILAKFARKYLCPDALRAIASMYWPLIPGWDCMKILPVSAMESLAAAKIFRLKAEFEAIALLIICLSPGPIQPPKSEEASEILGWSVHSLLDQAQLDKRVKIAEVFGQAVAGKRLKTGLNTKVNVYMGLSADRVFTQDDHPYQDRLTIRAQVDQLKVDLLLKAPNKVEDWLKKTLQYHVATDAVTWHANFAIALYL